MIVVGIRFRFTPVFLALLDGLAAVVCVFAAYQLRFHPFSFWEQAPGQIFDNAQPYFHMMLFAPAFRIFSGYLNGLYRYDPRGYRFGADLPQVFRSVCLGTALLVILAFFGVFQYQSFYTYRDFTYSRFFFFFDWLLNLVLLVGIHPLVGIVRTEVARRGVGLRRLVIQGADTEARFLALEEETLRENGYELVGILVGENEKPFVGLNGRTIPFLEPETDVLHLVNTHNIDEFVVTNASTLGHDFLEFVDECHKIDVVVQLVPNLQGMLFQNQPVSSLAGVPVIQVNEVAIRGLRRVLKRAEDILLSGAFLVLLSPLILATALAIALSSPGSVFFSQRRTGKYGRIFHMHKFRSMYKDAEEHREDLTHLNESDGPLFKIRNDPRITPVGRIIRKTSIDELPQLFNVFLGNMSLVGPRPLPASDLNTPGSSEESRLTMPPGITGMWQVNRLDHSSEEMFKWDLYYVENWSLWLDIKILFKTVFVVLTGRGAY